MATPQAVGIDLGTTSSLAAYVRHNPPVGKVVALESVRGIAALVVVVSHLLVGFFTDLYLSPPADIPPWLLVWCRGEFAVDVFFVLSGFVLSLSFVRSRRPETLRSAAARRYWRLSVPAGAAIMITYLLHDAGLYFNREAARLDPTNGSRWLLLWCDFDPSFDLAVWQSFWGAYFGPTDRTYNGVLWTLKYEYLGSLLLFAFLALTAGLKRRGLLYAIAGIALFRLDMLNFLEFLTGAAICELHNDGRLGRLVPRRASDPGSTAVVAAALLLAGLSPAWCASRFGTAPGPLTLIYLRPVAAALLIAGVLGSRPIRRLLAARPLLLLGRISFPLYLVHLPVQCSLGCWVYVRCVRDAGFPHGSAFGVAAAVSVTSSLLLAWIGSRTVEPLSIHVGHRFYAALFQPSRPKGGPGNTAAEPCASTMESRATPTSCGIEPSRPAP